MKSADINFDLKTLLPKLKKAQQVLTQHAVFTAIIAVLLVYVFMVWQINQLANADASSDAETAALAKSSVPQIDKNAIEQIKMLEQNNTQIKSLFDQARNNPFQE